MGVSFFLLSISMEHEAPVQAAPVQAAPLQAAPAPAVAVQPVVVQPAQAVPAVMGGQKTQWHQKDLFGCFMNDQCCFNTCCSCIALGRINEKLDGPLGFWGGCCGTVLLGGIPGMFILFLASRKLVQRHNIDEEELMMGLKS